MPSWSLNFEFEGQSISLAVGAPGISDPLDDCREVNFTIPGKGRHRAVFFLLPGDDPNDPSAVLPPSSWAQPVRWDEKVMLFIPTLADESILAAMHYIFANGLEAEAFENEDDIAADSS